MTGVEVLLGSKKTMLLVVWFGKNEKKTRTFEKKSGIWWFGCFFGDLSIVVWYFSGVSHGFEVVPTLGGGYLAQRPLACGSHRTPGPATTTSGRVGVHKVARQTLLLLVPFFSCFPLPRLVTAAMSLADALAAADAVLLDPLRGKARGFFAEIARCDDRLMSAMIYDKAPFTWMLSVVPFVESQGVDYANPQGTCKLIFERNDHRWDLFQKGDWIQIYDACKTETMNEKMLGAQSIVLPIPRIHRGTAWNMIHLFAGSFCGWHQAIQAIQSVNDQIMVDKEFAVDADESVMRSWSHSFSTVYRRPPFHWRIHDNAKHQGFCATVRDLSWLNEVNVACNLALTMSPPCVSWSLGGKESGLESIHGWTFLDAIRIVSISLPVFVAAECADALATHKHYPIITKAMTLLGYKQVWAQTLDLSQCFDMHRSRWLCVWVRCDVPAFPLPPSLHIRHSGFSRWTSPFFDFDTPKKLQSQLAFTDSLRKIYGDPRLLPKGKAKNLPPFPSEHQVLMARLPSLVEALPTLCSNYSTQHLLSTKHLGEKGIFASIDFNEGEFAFQSPVRFVALLGATMDISIPTKIEEAFHGLGNAIAVPQAALSLLVGLATVLDQHIPLNETISKIAELAITSRSHAVCEDNEYFRFVKTEHVLSLRETHPFRMEKCDTVPVFISRDAITLTSFPHASITIVTFLNHTLGLQAHHARETFLIPEDNHKKEPITLSCTVAEVEGIHELRFRGHTVASIDFRSSEPLPKKMRVAKAIECPPTLPFNISHDRNHVTEEDNCNEDQQLHAIFAAMKKHGISTFVDVGALNGTNSKHADLVHLVWIPTPISIQLFLSRPTNQTLKNLINTKLPGANCSSFVDENKLLHTKGKVAVILLDAKEAENHIVVCEENKRGGDLIALAFQPDTSVASLIDATSHMTFSHHNGKPISNPNAALRHLDVMAFRKQLPIECGGHPTMEDQRSANLPTPASLVDRLEFMKHTEGWLATDEMAFSLQLLTSKTEGLNTTGVARWDGTSHEFAFDNQQTPIFLEGALTIIPILINSHWAAIDVMIKRSTTMVTFVGLPQRFQQQALEILAPMLNTHQQRISVESLLSDHSTMCGWSILKRWFYQHCPGEQIRRADRAQLSPSTSQLVQDAVTTSASAWRQTQAPIALQCFAYSIRDAFAHQIAMQARSQTVPSVLSLTTAVGTPLAWFAANASTSTPWNPDDQEHKQYLFQRIASFAEKPLWLASDELELILDMIRLSSPDLYIWPPCQWSNSDEAFSPIRHQETLIQAYHQAIAFVEVDHHWVLLALHKNDGITVVTIFTNQVNHPAVFHLLRHMAFLCNAPLQSTTFITQYVNQPQDLCGWVLLQHLMTMTRTTVLAVTATQVHALAQHPFATAIIALNADSDRLWNLTPHDPNLRILAESTRMNFLLRSLHKRADTPYVSAGAGGNTDTDMDQPSSQNTADPLWTNDPWSPYTATKGKNSRWEDLILPTPSPFVDDKGKAIPQKHRHQITKTQGGVILATRANIREISDLKPNTSTAIILPQIDVAMYGDLSTKIQGPFEIILRDSQKNTTFKRIVQMLVVKDTVHFKLPKSITTIDVQAVAELVIEIDSRISSKEVINDHRDHPLASLKRQLANITATDALHESSFYGFRILHPQKQKDLKPVQLQCLVKVPEVKRGLILEASGRDQLFVRDFLKDPAQRQDCTVLPRFWEMSEQGHQQAMLATRGVAGFAGLILTKRGIAARIWTKEIASARQTLLPEDSRICEENKHVVPRVQYTTSGWPVGAQAINVVQAILQATKLAAVPFRTFRQAGVHCWIVAFEEHPKTKMFTITVNAKEHQILLHPTDETPFKPKGKGKGKGKKDLTPTEDPTDFRKGTRPILATPEQDRLDRLESKVASLETKFGKVEERQENFEAKIDTRFDSIQDQLRQLLQHAAPRARDATGETPPAKLSRHGGNQ